MTEVEQSFRAIGEYNDASGNGRPNLVKEHLYDAGLDVRSAEDTSVPAMGSKLVSTGIRIAIPRGHVGLLKSRSGLAVKHDIEVGAGVIDCGYRGEVKVLLRNFGQKSFSVQRGDRIAQLLTIEVNPGYYLQTQDELTDTTRGEGGFGSSGVA